jgi:hypothetical protein
MRARSSAKECLPAIVFLPLQFGQMVVIEPIAMGNHPQRLLYVRNLKERLRDIDTLQEDG